MCVGFFPSFFLGFNAKNAIMESNQYVLDEIHRLSSLLSKVMLKTERPMTKRSAVATLKELQIMGSELFRESGKTSSVIIDEDLPSIDRVIVSMCGKEGIDIHCNDVSRWKNDEEECLLLTRMKAQNNANGLAVEAAISFVRDIESKYKFQQRLYDEKQEVSKNLSCTLDNLTYGSSSITLWAELMQQDLVQRALAPGVEREFVVFGSSQGLLSLYTHALAIFHGLHTSMPGATVDSFNMNKITGNPTNKNKDKASVTGSLRAVRCVGYEVLPSLWALSNFLADKHFRGQHNDHLKFHLLDMMQADISGTDVLVLTSLCWDRETRKRVAHKLCREMKTGAVVIDYRAETFTDFDLDTSSRAYQSGISPRIDSDDVNVKPPQPPVLSMSVRVARAAVIESDMRALSSALVTYTKESAHQPEFNNLVFSMTGAQQSQSCIHPSRKSQIIGGIAVVTDDGAAADKETSRPMGHFELRSIIEGSCSWAVKQPLYIFTCVRP